MRKHKRKLRRTFIREWRQHKGLSLEKLQSRLETMFPGFELSYASLSRIERGLQPYNQEQLEAISAALGLEPADLLIRNPLDPEGIWSIWDQIRPEDRALAINLLTTLRKGG